MLYLVQVRTTEQGAVGKEFIETTGGADRSLEELQLRHCWGCSGGNSQWCWWIAQGEWLRGLLV